MTTELPPENAISCTHDTSQVEIMREEIKTAFTIAQTIIGPDKEILLYGGRVRNLLLGRNTSLPDYDFIANFNPDTIQSMFPNLFVDRWDEVSTIRFKIGYDNYDFTWTKNIPERLAIGDITISNICMDKEGHIIDFYGGADSLKNQEIKVLNPDFKFRKDPTRILRVIRLARELGFSIEEETWYSLIRNAPLLNLKENIDDELSKIFSLEPLVQEDIFATLEQIGVKKVTQNPVELEAHSLERKLEHMEEISQVEKLFDTKTYLVGGTPRDIIWGKKINDLDFKVFLPSHKIVQILEKAGLHKREDYKIETGEYYKSTFKGVFGINLGGRDIHISVMSTPDTTELIKAGDLNFNCCIYDVHSKKILTPEFIPSIKNKELRFVNPKRASQDPTITINALKQISKIPEIKIPEETDILIRNSILNINSFLEQNPNLRYLIAPICGNLNSERALDYLGEYKERITMGLPTKKSKLEVKSPEFHSEEICNLTEKEKENISEIIRKGYRDRFEPSKLFDGYCNSVVWETENGEMISCAILNGERLYSAAAPNRFKWVRLISEIVQNNYNLWGTVAYDNTKIRALCELSGLKIENNPKIIEHILKAKSHKYNMLEIDRRDNITVFKKGDVLEDQPQILVRS